MTPPSPRSPITTRSSAARRIPTVLHPTDTTHPHPETLQFVQDLYAGLTGWCNIGWCVGPPSTHTFTSPIWRYLDSDESRRALAHEIMRLAHQYGDVYLSRTLHNQPERVKATALPTRWVFADDAPRDVPVSFTKYISTGTGNGHGWYCLPHPIPTDDNERISQAIALHLQADSGFSITKMVRVPGTWNTKPKHGGTYPVHRDHAHTSGAVVTLDTLRTHYPESVIAIRDRISTELNRQQIERILGNMHHLLDSEGLPARIRVHNPRTAPAHVITTVNQTRENFRQWKAGNFYNTKASVQRDDTTGCRFTAAKALAYHYPDHEIAALLLHFIPETRKRGEQWLWNDLAACISKGIAARTASYAAKDKADWQPRAALNLSNATSKPARIHADPLPPHRPAALTPARVFRFYQEMAQADCVDMTRAQRAAQLGVPPQTLYRIDKILERNGLIECSQSGRHGGRVVVLVDTFKDRQKSPQGSSEVPPHERMETLKSASQRDEAHHDALMGTHVFPASPEDATGSDAVPHTEYPCTTESGSAVRVVSAAPEPEPGPATEVFDDAEPVGVIARALPSTMDGVARGKESVALSVVRVVESLYAAPPLNPRTGEIIGAKWSKQRMIGAVAALHGPRWSAATITAAFNQVRSNRNAGAFIAYRVTVKAMVTADLVQEAAKKRTAATRRAGTPREAYHRMLDQIAHTELARRNDRSTTPPVQADPVRVTQPVTAAPGHRRASRVGRNVSRVPVSAVLPGETLLQAYDRLFGSGSMSTVASSPGSCIILD